MLTFTIRRLILAVPTLLFISLVIYSLLEFAPGDPMANMPLTIPDEVKQQMREALGVGQPIWISFPKWLYQFFIVEPLVLIDGIFGSTFSEGQQRIISWQTRSPVMDIVAERLPQTLWVVGTAYVVAVLIALPIGIYSAYRQYSVFDQAGTFVAMVGYSVPPFFSGVLVIVIFSVNLGWLPSIYDTTHVVTDWSSFKVQLNQMILPVMVLALQTTAQISRYMRAAMLDKMEQYRVVDLQLGTPSWLRGSQPNTGIGSLVMRAKEEEFTAEGSIQDLRTTIKALQDLDGDELIKAAVDLGVNNQTLTKRYPDYQTALLTRESLRESGVGNKHPKSLNLDRQIELLKEMLLEAVDTAKSALGTRLSMAEQTLLNTKATKEGIEQRSLRERRENLEYIDAKKDYELSKEVLNKMQENLDKESIDVGSTQTPIVMHENAVEQLLPARPNIQLHIILGAVVGLVFGVGMAFFLEYLDTSVKSLEDVERYLGVPVLAVIPNEVGILHKQSGLAPDAEAYRILRTNIEFNRRSADANAISIVSGGAGEGKSTTLVNLAYVCAQGGYTTLMIDADLRRPQLHTFFDVNNSVGLTNYLTTDLVLEDVILQTPVENLYFMPSGILPADAAGILNSRRMSELMADVKSRFDLVLVDSPPILGVSDASVLASEADLTMAVIQHRKLPRAMLVRVKQAVENVGGDLFGVVLNNVDVRSDNQYQYYTSYYTYYSPSNIQETAQDEFLDESSGDKNELEVAEAANHAEDEY